MPDVALFFEYDAWTHARRCGTINSACSPWNENVQVDLANLVDSREQELRAIAAEVRHHALLTDDEIGNGNRSSTFCLYVPHARRFCQRDILQEEVRVARSLIGGRESDLLAVRSENDKVSSEPRKSNCISCTLSNSWREISFDFVNGAEF